MTQSFLTSDPSDERHITELALARRWQVSLRTLQRWRGQGKGPDFLRLGHGIRYRIADVIDFESRHISRGGPAS